MGKILVLDAGHGLTTAGKQTMNGSAGIIKEWSLNDAVCRYIEDYLKEYEVTIHRTDDTTGKTDISLTERVRRCNAYRPDLFVSIHHNSYNEQSTGTEVYWHTKGTAEDKKVASILAPKLSANCNLRNRGVKQEAFTVLTCQATAILAEGGFMSNPKDYEVITKEAGLRAYAKAVADTVIEVLALAKKQGETTKPTAGEVFYQVICGSYKNKETAEALADKLTKAGYSGVWINRIVK